MNLVLAHVTQGGYSVIVSVTCSETLKKKNWQYSIAILLLTDAIVKLLWMIVMRYFP